MFELTVMLTFSNMHIAGTDGAEDEYSFIRLPN